MVFCLQSWNCQRKESWPFNLGNGKRPSGPKEGRSLPKTHPPVSLHFTGTDVLGYRVPQYLKITSTLNNYSKSASQEQSLCPENVPSGWCVLVTVIRWRRRRSTYSATVCHVKRCGRRRAKKAFLLDTLSWRCALDSSSRRLAIGSHVWIIRDESENGDVGQPHQPWHRFLPGCCSAWLVETVSQPGQEAALFKWSVTCIQNRPLSGHCHLSPCFVHWPPHLFLLQGPSYWVSDLNARLFHGQDPHLTRLFSQMSSPQAVPPYPKCVPFISPVTAEPLPWLFFTALVTTCPCVCLWHLPRGTLSLIWAWASSAKHEIGTQ